ncbi:hypothetical protein HPB49_014079 [Dermacentor silvarum]|uniref:Uncharacterized protein n=1 Tax=Dermacentor silvarum TaxID=543639 RepID=A0ACB8E0T3_DERSI|nr:hypothetical protein HPB49_014079 [Dermacentor silvarum]
MRKERLETAANEGNAGSLTCGRPARQSLTKRWKRQRRNRKLARRIAELNNEISEYVAKLRKENWLQVCDGLQGQLSVGKTWKLLRHLIDPAGSKTANNRLLTKVRRRRPAYEGPRRPLFSKE